VKLIWGHHMLGLGDIVVPGIVLSFSLRFDLFRSNRWSNGFFLGGLLGYCFGMIISIVMALVFRHPQPALLYLVPCTLLPIFFGCREEIRVRSHLERNTHTRIQGRRNNQTDVNENQKKSREI